MQKHADKSKEAGDKSITGMMAGFKALGSAADLLTADIRAAKDLGYNTAEYQWIKEKILEASSAAVGAKFQEAMTAGMDKAYQDAKKAYDEAKDEQTKQTYAQVIAGYEQSRKEMQEQKQQEDPAIAYNRQLLTKYEDAMKAWTAEMSKFEDKEGQAEKSMEEMQKNLDKTIEESKKDQ
jgi:hypothetical protein